DSRQSTLDKRALIEHITSHNIQYKQADPVPGRPMQLLVETVSLEESQKLIALDKQPFMDGYLRIDFFRIKERPSEREDRRDDRRGRPASSSVSREDSEVWNKLADEREREYFAMRERFPRRRV